jgi:enoyl-CoA hydratase
VPVHYDGVGDHIVKITIDRPEKRNALDLHHFRDLAAAWRQFRDDADGWVAVVTGVGRNFMAGADLKTYIPQVTALRRRGGADDEEIDGCTLRDGTDAVLRSLTLSKPIIAAVNGPCVAGGMELLGATDIRIATEHAVFGLMEPKRGLFAGGGSTVRLPRQIPYAAAMEFLLTADAVPASRALEVGLLNEIVPEDELWERALAWAHRITANAPLAVQATKESVLRASALELEAAYRMEAEISHRVFATEDAREGPLAFVEKRPPVWRGR